MINSLEAIKSDTEAHLWATVGLESGVQEQTAAALEIMKEVAVDLNDMEGIAVVPVGSRFKGYATQRSDLDVAVVQYDDWGISPYTVRARLHTVIRERLGIQVRHNDIGADEALTIDLVDYGQYGLGVGTPFCLAFLFPPTIFVGDQAEERRQVMIDDLFTQGERLVESTNTEFNNKFVRPKSWARIPARYMELFSLTDHNNYGTYGLVEAAFKGMYRARLEAFGSTVSAWQDAPAAHIQSANSPS